MTSTSPPIVIIGGGLAGSLMSLYFAKRGLPVTVVEYRSDIGCSVSMDTSQVPSRSQCGIIQLATSFGVLADAAKRSINLALSYRGIQALKEQGLCEE